MKIEIKYAFGIAAASLLWLIFEMSVGLHDTNIRYHPYLTWIGMLIPVFGIRMALGEKRESLEGVLPFKTAVISGLVVTVLLAVLSVPVQYVFHEYINPDFFSNAIEAAVPYYKSSQHVDEATAQSMAEANFNLSNYMRMSFIGSLVFGVVITLVFSWFLRSREKVSQS